MTLTVKTESLPAEDVYRNLLRRFRTAVLADRTELGIRHWEIGITQKYAAEWTHNGERLVNSLLLTPNTVHASAPHFEGQEPVRVRIYRESGSSWVWSGERDAQMDTDSCWRVRHPYDTPQYAILRGMEWLVMQVEDAMRAAADAEIFHPENDWDMDDLVAHHQELMLGLRAVKTAKPGIAQALEPAAVPVYDLEPAPAMEVK